MFPGRCPTSIMASGDGADVSQTACVRAYSGGPHLSEHFAQFTVGQRDLMGG